jgi:hypothetical protein
MDVDSRVEVSGAADAAIEGSRPLRFEQIHIDAARNATDDFNPFHDPRKAGLIRANPYAGTIVLGFQLECLIGHRVDLHRDACGEHSFIERNALHYTNYHLTFASALLPRQPFRVEIRPTLIRTDPPSLANRVLVRSDAGMVISGHVRETGEPMVLADREWPPLPELRQSPDRERVPGTPYFLKRKFMNTGNAKNFLAGSLCDQGHYFDELAERVSFPGMFPSALMSCALLEKAMSEGHDFLADPMVYIAHSIAVDRRLARRLRSNDVLHMLVDGPQAVEGEKGLGTSGVKKLRFNCLGVVEPSSVLYRAEVLMAPLDSITAALRQAPS